MNRFIIALLLVACGTQPTTTVKQPELKFSLGAAHVAGEYLPGSQQHTRPTLLEGANLVQKLGGETLKVYLTPNVAEKYGDDFANATSLKELAASPAYEALFAQPFKTFVLTTYSFNLGLSDAWRQGLSAAQIDAEEAELFELTQYLLTKYADRDVRFVLQNWEGDWALLGNYKPETNVAVASADGMVQWLSARQRGVERARNEAKSQATVYHAVEVNRVLDAEGTAVRVVSHVLPHLTVDAVSYSSWEILPEDRTLMNPGTVVSSRLRTAFERIRAAAPTSAIYIGEFGVPENEMNQRAAQSALDAAVKTTNELGAAGMVYWQIIDNECAGDAPAGCRGFWLTKPDGKPSFAASVLFNH